MCGLRSLLRRLPWASVLAAAMTAVCLAVGSIAYAEPPLAPVSGKVTYDDDSLIPGARIQLVFIPLGQVPQGQSAPRPSIADVDVENGGFKSMSTYRQGDGASVGHHRVMVTVLGPDAKLNGAVPAVFSDPATTPLRIEVENRRNWIHFQLPKPEQ